VLWVGSGTDSETEIAFRPNLDLTPEQAEAIFKGELGKLQAEGVVPKQNWLAEKVSPQFEFRPEYAHDNNGPLTGASEWKYRKHQSLEVVQRSAYENSKQLISGQTNASGTKSRIFMSAASSGSIRGIGSATPQQMMRYVLLHELGHQSRSIGGGGSSAEAGAAAFAKKRF
jgi:hypothetical protein